MPGIDAWLQHPTPRRSRHETFESLRRSVKESGFVALRLIPWL